MLSTDRMLRSAALEQFQGVFGPDADLLSASLRLRMACNGSSDPMTLEELKRGSDALHVRLLTWAYDDRPEQARFDQAVFELVGAALVEVDAEIRRLTSQGS